MANLHYAAIELETRRAIIGVALFELMANGLFQHSLGQRPRNLESRVMFWPTAMFSQSCLG
jgi:hypothetical protein